MISQQLCDSAEQSTASKVTTDEVHYICQYMLTSTLPGRALRVL
jgi:hypothetical protein